MNFTHVMGNIFFGVVLDTFEIVDEALCNSNKCITWPRMEKVYGRAIDQARETPGTNAECIPNGGETENNMKIFADTRDEKLSQCLGRIRYSRCLGLVAKV